MYRSLNFLYWNGECFIFVFICVILFILEKSTTCGEQAGEWSQICPLNCTCKISKFKTNMFSHPLKIVNCSRVGLKNFPENISVETEALILSYNKLKKLDIPKKFKKLQYLDVSYNKIHLLHNMERLSRLKFLDLNKNSLYFLQNGHFSGMKYLTSLDLSNNKLHSIEKHAFGGLNGLQRLYLDGNKLYSLEKQWFIGMPSLRILHLSKNSLSSLEKNIFENMNNLMEVKLLNNKIRTIEENAFQGLTELRILDLSSNQLSIIPSEHLHNLTTLKYLLLDNNPIYSIHTGSFSSLSIKMLSISYMPKLVVIEKHSFTKLTKLVTLQIHDNNNLVYIDPKMFDYVPVLKNLYLHNNKLRAISEKIRTSLPSLKNCHIYNNPLHCDCNALWIKRELVKEEKRNYTSMLFDDSVLICESPSKYSRMLLKELPLSTIHSKCAATAIPMFNNSYNISVGEELRLQCHAIGIPQPEIEWILPNGSTLEGSFKNDRYEIINNCTLVVRHLRTSDSGTFKCKAFNSLGFDISSTIVTINNKPIRIFPSGISADFVTVGWNGTRYWSMISDYQIHCRDIHKSQQNNQIIHLRPFSKHFSYTFKNLKPQTTYEFCIVYVYETEFYDVDCINVTTNHQIEFYSSGITRINSKLVAGVCTVTFMLLAFCCGTAVIRRFNKRKDYLDPTPDEKGDFMSQIPLDNLNQPPSTPLCSSRTALISSSDPT